MLLIGLLSCQLIIFAQSQPNSMVVEIGSDTTIIVRNLWGDSCKLYGDFDINENPKRQLGGEKGYFKRNMTNLNGDSTLLNYIDYDSVKGLHIKFEKSEYDKMSKELNFKFYGRTYIQKRDWCPDTNAVYSVRVVKKTPPPPGEESSSQVPDDIKNILETYNNLWLVLAIVYIIIFLCLIITIIRTRNLSKKVNKLEINQDSIPLKKSEDLNIDEIKQSVISNIQSKDLAQRISDNDIYNIINKPDIQSYIKSVIEHEIKDCLHDKVNMPTPPDIDIPVQPAQTVQTVQSALRTTKVEYLADKNSFVISENPAYEIFEIYSADGAFYYTIINDSTLRRNLLGIISAYKKCIEYRLDSPNPSTIEVIRDGRLIKNGDVYVVDTNCKLQISLR